MSQFNKLNERRWQQWVFSQALTPILILLDSKLSSIGISSLHETFTIVLHTYTWSSIIIQTPNALVTFSTPHSAFKMGQPFQKYHNRCGNCSLDIGGVICTYCHEFDHMKRYCWKLHNKNMKFQSALVASTPTNFALVWCLFYQILTIWLQFLLRILPSSPSIKNFRRIYHNLSLPLPSHVIQMRVSLHPPTNR